MFFIFGKTGGHIAEMILDYSRVINNMNLYLLVNECHKIKDKCKEI